MHTHFCNPHGLPAQGRETTARELARIAAEASKHEEFRRIVGTKSVTVPWTGRGLRPRDEEQKRAADAAARRQRHRDRGIRRRRGGASWAARSGRNAADHSGAATRRTCGKTTRSGSWRKSLHGCGRNGCGAGGGDLRVGSACMGRRDAGCGGGRARYLPLREGEKAEIEVDSARNHRKRGCSRAEFGVCSKNQRERGWTDPLRDPADLRLRAPRRRSEQMRTRCGRSRGDGFGRRLAVC